MSDEAWHLVKNTPKVTGFVGSGKEPTPLTDEEVEQILHRSTRRRRSPSPGTRSRRARRCGSPTGRSRTSPGVVEDVNLDRATLKVMVTIFGRATPVELEFLQVQKLKEGRRRWQKDHRHSSNCRSRAGEATPAPPGRHRLSGPAGVNIMDFCKNFNAQDGEGKGAHHSRGDHGLRRPLVHVHHEDPAGAGAAAQGGRREKGSGQPNKEKVGKVTKTAGRGHRRS